MADYVTYNAATGRFEPHEPVEGQVTALIDGAPAALDTLNELAAALGDDAGAFLAHVADTLAHSSGIEIDYEVDESGVVYTLATGAVAAIGVPAATCPAQTRPVWASWGFLVDTTASPADNSLGVVAAQVEDDLGGIFASGAVTIPHTTGSTAGLTWVYGHGRIGTVGAERTYTLKANKSGSASFTGNILNGSGAAVFRSWLLLYTR